MTLSWATDGWAVWTQETARRIRLVEDATLLPNPEIFDNTGKNKRLHQAYKKDDVVLIDFVFTRCATVCLAMGYEFRELQSVISQSEFKDRVKFISLSFDHEYDTSELLDAYLDRFSADKSTWISGGYVDKQALDDSLDQLGVIAIPDVDFGYIHNSAIYVLKDSHIVGIFDYDNKQEILQKILAELHG